MKTHFSHMGSKNKIGDGAILHSAKDVTELLAQLRLGDPVMCNFEAEDGDFLTVGVGADVGCVQFTGSDHQPPYLMAVGDQSVAGNRLFDLDGSETEVEEQYCLSFTLLEKIVQHFVENGQMLQTVSWEEV
jgi:hypothetical protein